MPANPCQPGVDRLVAGLLRQNVDCLGVAYSGGADSTALLLAVHERWPGRVQALHVNHGMQAAASSFEQHCVRVCGELGIPLHIANLAVKPSRGESPEAAARQARYAALASLSSKFAIQNIAIAQHADDQVETVLLALSRGAGVKGLSGMPPSFHRHGVHFHRPLLDVSAAAIREWLSHAVVAWVDDPSNTDEKLTRNRIRHQLMPAIRQAFPAFRQTVARSARHAAQAQRLLTELAELDAQTTGMPPKLKALQGLNEERQANLLRHWLVRDHGVSASEAQMTELLKQIASCQTRGHRIHLRVALGHVDRVGAALKYLPDPSPV